jgi:hypothetical protein
MRCARPCRRRCEVAARPHPDRHRSHTVARTGSAATPASRHPGWRHGRTHRADLCLPAPCRLHGAAGPAVLPASATARRSTPVRSPGPAVDALRPVRRTRRQRHSTDGPQSPMRVWHAHRPLRWSTSPWRDAPGREPRRCATGASRSSPTPIRPNTLPWRRRTARPRSSVRRRVRDRPGRHARRLPSPDPIAGRARTPQAGRARPWTTGAATHRDPGAPCATRRPGAPSAVHRGHPGSLKTVRADVRARRRIRLPATRLERAMRRRRATAPVAPVRGAGPRRLQNPLVRDPPRNGPAQRQ